MTDSSDRPEWLSLYADEYWTLEEIGSHEGVSREAIRQRLRGMGVTPRSASEAHELRRIRETNLRGLDIRETFLRLRSADLAADALGMRLTWIKAYLLENVPEYKVVESAPRNMAKRFSVEELLDSLSLAASTQSGILANTDYDEFVRLNPLLANGRPRPTKQAMALRFGSWRAAQAAAGLPSNPRGGPSPQFTEAMAIEAVVACWGHLGHAPNHSEYEQWQQGREGRPSGSTVRNLAGPWNLIRVRAWQLVYGIQLDQDDIDVTVPQVLVPQLGELISRFQLVDYVAADEGVEISVSVAMTSDGYQSLERAMRSHATVQNAVADAARDIGLRPRMTADQGPRFDIALEADDGTLYVVEVKSATVINLELQLRIALGQVLRYVHEVRGVRDSVVPVIAIELQPPLIWIELLRELGVGLAVQATMSADIRRIVGSPSNV